MTVACKKKGAYHLDYAVLYIRVRPSALCSPLLFLPNLVTFGTWVTFCTQHINERLGMSLGVVHTPSSQRLLRVGLDREGVISAYDYNYDTSFKD